VGKLVRFELYRWQLGALLFVLYVFLGLVFAVGVRQGRALERAEIVRVQQAEQRDAAKAGELIRQHFKNLDETYRNFHMGEKPK
jgi:hypothetical protein